MLEHVAHGRVFHHRNVRRHLEHAATAQFANGIDDLRVVFGAPVEARIHVAPVVGFVLRRPVLGVLYLPGDDATKGRLQRGKPAKGFAHSRNLVCTRGLGDARGKTDQQAHLGVKTHVRLVIAVTMRRRLDIDVARQHRIVVHEHFFPRHLDLVAHHHAVSLVIAMGERAVELDLGVALERLPRPQRQAPGITGHGAGHRLRQLRRRQRNEVADPDFIGEHRAGGEHFHARDHQAVILLAYHAQGRDRDVLLDVELRIARRLRRNNGIAGVNVVLAHVLVIARDVVGVFAEHLGQYGHTGDKARHMVGRTTKQTVTHGGDLAMQGGAFFQVGFGARAQEIGAVTLPSL